MNALTKTEEYGVPEKRERQIVSSTVAIWDTSKFEHMYRVSKMMAMSTIPETLRGNTFDETIANCMQISNFALSSNMDPFAVAQCSSIIKGRLCFEGKLIQAIIDVKLDIKLKYNFDGKNLDMEITISHGDRELRGKVRDWKTSGSGSPWFEANYEKMLINRGNREWVRRFEPALLLGIYAQDEMQSAEAELYTNNTPSKKSLSPPPPPVDEETSLVPNSSDRAANGDVEEAEILEEKTLEQMTPEEVFEQAIIHFRNSPTQDDLDTIWELNYQDLDIGSDDSQHLESLYKDREAELTAKLLEA